MSTNKEKTIFNLTQSVIFQLLFLIGSFLLKTFLDGFNEEPRYSTENNASNYCCKHQDCPGLYIYSSTQEDEDKVVNNCSCKQLGGRRTAPILKKNSSLSFGQSRQSSRIPSYLKNESIIQRGKFLDKILYQRADGTKASLTSTGIKDQEERFQPWIFERLFNFLEYGIIIIKDNDVVYSNLTTVFPSKTPKNRVRSIFRTETKDMKKNFLLSLDDFIKIHENLDLKMCPLLYKFLSRDILKILGKNEEDDELTEKLKEAIKTVQDQDKVEKTCDDFSSTLNQDKTYIQVPIILYYFSFFWLTFLGESESFNCTIVSF